jgi:hypothetical protein
LTDATYQTDWLAFSWWRRLSDRIALPAAPETVSEHLASELPAREPVHRLNPPPL